MGNHKGGNGFPVKMPGMRASGYAAAQAGRKEFSGKGGVLTGQSFYIFTCFYIVYLVL